MTEKAHPSINRTADPFKMATGLAAAGDSGDGYVVDGASPTELATQDSGIDETALNAFAETSGGASLDVTIDPGEAFVYGSWVAKDTSTTVTLAASTADQTVYVGWNKDSPDDVIVGLASDFASAAGDTDMKIPLFDFDTDGSGVTAVTDRRTIGPLLTSRALDRLVANPDGKGSYALQNGDLVRWAVPVPDGQTLRVYRWGCRDTTGTTPAGLKVQLADETETVQTEANTADAISTDATSPVASLANTSGGLVYYWLQLKNATGSDYADPDGAAAHFAFIVE